LTFCLFSAFFKPAFFAFFLEISCLMSKFIAGYQKSRNFSQSGQKVENFFYHNIKIATFSLSGKNFNLIKKLFFAFLYARMPFFYLFLKVVAFFLKYFIFTLGIC
jgi:hypothetical protein